MNYLTGKKFKTLERSFWLFRILHCRAPGRKALENKGAEKIVLYSKIAPNSPEEMDSSKEEKAKASFVEQEAPGQAQTQQSLQRVEARTGSLGRIHRDCPAARDQVRKDKTKLKIKVNTNRDIKGKKKSFFGRLVVKKD